jgi:hypothetical protein
MADYEVLNARVKQKIDTEANWIAAEDTFGVIFEGEQAFVKTDSGTPVNFKIGDGTKTFSELPYFIAYYSNVTNQKVLSYVGDVDITISSVFKANSLLNDIAIYNTSGAAITLNIGLTEGGAEITTLNIPNGVNIVGLKYLFDDVETVYLSGIAGNECSIFVLYVQMDESPATPPSLAASNKFPAGFTGIFREVPSLGLTYSTVWDFGTGLAKLGFGYDNCVICGTNETVDPNGAISVPYKASDTVVSGTFVGTSGNSIVLTVDQLPTFTVKTPINAERYHTQSRGTDNPYGAAGPPVRTDLLTSQPVGSSAPISIQNYGLKDLWFIAISN